jgi:hypothetical protein
VGVGVGLRRGAGCEVCRSMLWSMWDSPGWAPAHRARANNTQYHEAYLGRLLHVIQMAIHKNGVVECVLQLADESRLQCMGEGCVVHVYVSQIEPTGECTVVIAVNLLFGFITADVRFYIHEYSHPTRCLVPSPKS